MRGLTQRAIQNIPEKGFVTWIPPAYSSGISCVQASLGCGFKERTIDYSTYEDSFSDLLVDVRKSKTGNHCLCWTKTAFSVEWK